MGPIWPAVRRVRLTSRGRATASLLTCLAVLGSLLLVSPAQATPMTDDYPTRLKNVVQDGIADPWNFWNRECTSFVAWRLNNDGGVAFHNYYLGRHWGDASNWAAAAGQVGVPVDHTPTVGAVAWWAAGSSGSWSGHVAYVARASATQITIEEYNWVHRGAYSTRVIDSTSRYWPTAFVHVTPTTLTATRLPAITGDVRVAEPLVADPGAWTSSGAAFRYAWYADGSPIPGADRRRFRPQGAQLGARLSVKVTATQLGLGSTTVSSARSAAVAPGTLGNVAMPAVTGEPRVGVPLSADPGAWSRAVESTYQWYSGADPVAAATLPTFTPTADQLGRRVSVLVTGRRTGFVDTVARSPKSDKVAVGVLTSSSDPVITGTPRVGSALTLDPGTWSTGVTHTVQWYADGVALPGATTGSYTPTPADLGRRLTAQVDSSQPGYAPTTSTAPATTAVTKGVLTVTGEPTVTGTNRVGELLTAVPGAWSPQAALSYQWLADGAPLTGETGPTLRLTPDRLDQAVTVRVRAARPGYLTALTTSAPTAPVAPGELAALEAATVAGDPRLGVEVEATPGTWSLPEAQVSYQWFVQGQAVEDATSAAYAPRRGDVGLRLAVRVTAVAPGYAPTTLTAVSGRVLRGDAALDAAPELVGRARLGHVLHVTRGIRSPTYARVTYHWFRGEQRLWKAHGRHYAVRVGDVGHRLRVRVRVSRDDWASTVYLTDRTERTTSRPRLTAGATVVGHRVEVTAAVRAPGVAESHGTVRLRRVGRVVDLARLSAGRGDLVTDHVPSGNRRLVVVYRDHASDSVLRRVLRIHVL